MEVNESDMDGVRIRKNQREKERVTALKFHFMDLKRRLPFPEEQVKTRAQILIRAAEYVDALERRIFQMQDSQNSDERNKEEIFRNDLSSCRFSSGRSYLEPRQEINHGSFAIAHEFHETEMQRDLMSPTSLALTHLYLS
ncbi:uncharacterized protein [Acropora muricata]|uniref:uncharacterized protein LOC114953065 n=1 Tax=Acropora millepora TaxID=45264 RepID=UPI001CF0F20E|nr:uncharacterized protein LOC114953065 [Acropora millepora]